MTITTADIHVHIRELRAGIDVESRKVYDTGLASIESSWKEWLYQDAAPDLSKEAADLIFQKAWDDGHSGGYEEVDMHFRDLVALVQSVMEVI